MARRWFHHLKRLEALNEDYDDCPIRCPKDKANEYDIYRGDVCDKCPRRISAKQFEREVEKEWDTFLKDDAKKLRFVEVYQAVRELVAAKDIPEDAITAKTGKLLGIYWDEKEKFERLNP